MICTDTIYLNVRQLKPLGLKAIELARFYCIHTSRQLIRSLVGAKDLNGCQLKHVRLFIRFLFETINVGTGFEYFFS